MNGTFKNLIIGGSKLISLPKAGFSIVELLVALILAAIVTSAAMSLYITQHKQLLVQDQISDMQSSVRAATAELATKIRMAGYNIPDPVLPIVAANTNPDTITIAYDESGGVNIAIAHAMPQPSAELRCDDSDLSALHDNDYLYIYDPATKTGEFFLATHIQYSSGHIQHNTANLSRAYPVGSQIFKIRRFKYYIDNTSDANHPNFMIAADGNQGQVFAENITNLNFSYKLSSGAIVDIPPLSDMIREVIITVNARAERADTDFRARNYRTRTLSTRVKVRNLGVN